MAWWIACSNEACGETTRALDIVDLLTAHTDEVGWFLCGECGKPGYIEKSYERQEGGEPWRPFLRGAIPLGNPGETYQPFVFLVAYEPTARVDSVWFSYYKDLRSSGGRLKLGYGPGGPPVLFITQVRDLVGKLNHLVPPR